MAKVFKWLFGLTSLLLMAAVFALALGYGVLLNTIPADEGTATLSGIEAEVEVVFDEHSVPHIEAGSMQDAMFTLGFVHARERLWQMEFLRRVGQGRLSEALGEATVDTDIFLRTLNMADAAKASFEKLQPETKQALEAYSQGVNAFQTRERRTIEPVNGAEFIILGVSPEPWEAWNSLLVLKVMGLSLSKNMETEIQRLALASQGFSPQEIDDVIPYGPRDNPPNLPDLRRLYGFGKDGKEKTASVDGQQNKSASLAIDFPIGRSASNNWVISGDRTVSGKPILANDPHLGLTAPSTFFLVHMSFPHRGETHELIGGTLPGVPTLITGRNARVAWGLTTTNLDAQDLMLEKLNPKKDQSYFIGTGWKNFESYEEVIKVSGGDSVTFQRRTSDNGPVLPDNFRNLEAHLPEGYVASLKWTGLARDDTTLDTLFENMFSQNVSDFIESARFAVSPMQSVVVGDVDGNIALSTPGRVPVRGEENLVKGRAPVPGWLPQYQWQSTVQSSDVPVVVNPESGALTTANANFLPNDYPLHLTYDWAEHFRQGRAEALVYNSNAKHDVSKSREIISDNFSPPLFELARYAAQAELSGVGERGEIFLALAQWNGEMRADRAEPLIMLSWFRHLHEAIFKDDLGEVYELFDRGRMTRILNVLKRGSVREWCDDIKTSTPESCNDILSASLDTALAELKNLLGGDWQTWDYGKLHVAVHEHRPFGKVAALSRFFNIEVASHGGPYTLNRGQMDFGNDAPYSNTHAAAYRAIYDFSDLDKSLYIQSTGQSGNFLSEHYDDFAFPWSQSRFVVMTTKKSDYSKNAKGTWIFKPE